MKKINKLFLTFILMLASLSGFSQEVEMADVMRSEGKIYVVVAIILIILTGLIGYLFLLDRKVSKIEKRLGEK